MSSLTPEERRRIYEEEKTRLEAQSQLARQRSEPLEREIESYLSRGFRVLSRTDTTAQLIKPRRYDPTWGCLGFLTFGVFWVIGLLVFLMSKDQLVYLSLDASGQVLIDNKTPQAAAQAQGDVLRGWGIIALAIFIVIIAIVVFGNH